MYGWFPSRPRSTQAKRAFLARSQGVTIWLPSRVSWTPRKRSAYLLNLQFVELLRVECWRNDNYSSLEWEQVKPEVTAESKNLILFRKWNNSTKFVSDSSRRCIDLATPVGRFPNCLVGAHHGYLVLFLEQSSHLTSGFGPYPTSFARAMTTVVRQKYHRVCRRTGASDDYQSNSQIDGSSQRWRRALIGELKPANLLCSRAREGASFISKRVRSRGTERTG